MWAFTFFVLTSVALSVEGVVVNNDAARKARDGELIASSSYINQFFAAMGESISHLFGMSSQRQMQFIPLQYNHTLANTTVKFRTCPKNGDKCKARSGEPLTCGKAVHHGRIVNGTSAAPGSQPWAVQIRFKNEKVFCSATLISNQFAVTAAHCLYRMRTNDKVLVLGNLYTKSKSQFQQSRRIEKVYMREDFDIRTYDNDIALIKLDKPVEFNDGIRPICLPDVSEDYAGIDANVIGWGHLEHNGDLPKQLQEVTVPVMSQQKCKYETKFVPQEITENMMCAGYDEGLQDACQGDSGGALIKTEDTHKMLIGIVSWGIECARPGLPGVYTRVGSYLEWIKHILEEEEDCVCEQEIVEPKMMKEMSLEMEILKLRQQLELLAQKGVEVIGDLTSKLEDRENVISNLQETIKEMEKFNNIPIVEIQLS